jgi:hypothetical protein
MEIQMRVTIFLKDIGLSRRMPYQTGKGVYLIQTKGEKQKCKVMAGKMAQCIKLQKCV